MSAALSVSPEVGPAAESSASDPELLARFVRSADESAFAHLIRRHGPMVLGVCRRILANHHDAEDAFQATFTLLARKAGELAHPERLAGWLYGVAQRLSLRLREVRTARQRTESNAVPPTPGEPQLECAWREVQVVLDEEIGKLDSPLRDVIVMCYLQGKTHEAAARELGRPVGSISWLMSKALQTLRSRLTVRGMTLTGGMSSLLLALRGPLPVSEELLLTTLRATGTVATASPLAAFLDLVGTEMTPTPTHGVGTAVALTGLLLLGLGAVAYQAWPAPSPPTSTPVISPPGPRPANCVTPAAE